MTKTQTGSTARSIAEICSYPGPSSSEADSIVKLVRSGNRTEAVKEIEKAFYACTEDEAEKLYDAYVDVVVGKPSTLVEIKVSEVEVAQASENLFDIPQQYVARRAGYIGTLLRPSKHYYYLEGRPVPVSEIDQVWKLVPLSVGAGAAKE
ncbi:hypothetical protein [Rhizobium sp. BK176]|uniref:hypothetical protein n=1 Tax=Rhizobium sp. BK176 TaxID=2587071 RepID=UPI00216AA0AC|nr:hypothetical protein [Rhizobium sp. BK176]MCS4088559.1 hypothetical protein [Rhizobium sp. BK176]